MFSKPIKFNKDLISNLIPEEELQQKNVEEVIYELIYKSGKPYKKVEEVNSDIKNNIFCKSTFNKKIVEDVNVKNNVIKDMKEQTSFKKIKR